MLMHVRIGCRLWGQRGGLVHVCLVCATVSAFAYAYLKYEPRPTTKHPCAQIAPIIPEAPWKGRADMEAALNAPLKSNHHSRLVSVLNAIIADTVWSVRRSSGPQLVSDRSLLRHAQFPTQRCVYVMDELRLYMRTSALGADARKKRELDSLGRMYATGRRKTSVARVWVSPGEGRLRVNGTSGAEYFARVWIWRVFSSLRTRADHLHSTRCV